MIHYFRIKHTDYFLYRMETLEIYFKDISRLCIFIDVRDSAKIS